MFCILDNFVGGGLTEGRGVLETALKEAGEEAGLPQQLAAGTVISHHSVNIHPVSGSESGIRCLLLTPPRIRNE
jgi:hypothetical protein